MRPKTYHPSTFPLAMLCPGCLEIPEDGARDASPLVLVDPVQAAGLARPVSVSPTATVPAAVLVPGIGWGKV